MVNRIVSYVETGLMLVVFKHRTWPVAISNLQELILWHCCGVAYCHWWHWRRRDQRSLAKQMRLDLLYPSVVSLNFLFRNFFWRLKYRNRNIYSRTVGIMEKWQSDHAQPSEVFFFGTHEMLISIHWLESMGFPTKETLQPLAALISHIFRSFPEAELIGQLCQAANAVLAV